MRNSFFILLLLSFCMAASLSAQRRSDAIAPPPVVALSLTVKQGETLIVPLGIHGARGERLEFVIRSQPRFGKISEVRATGINTAQVSYTAPQKGEGEDRFTYAVRNSDGVSAPGIVSINIVAPVALPAKLVASEKIDFPKVFPGQRAVAEVELRNTGGTALEGEARVAEPWSIEGEKSYQISPGGSFVLKVVFVAEKPGTFTSDIALGPQPLRNVTVKCEVEEPLVVSPASLWLSGATGEKAREGILQLTNRLDEDLVVNIVAGARLNVSKVITIRAGAKLNLSIAVDDTAPEEFDESLILQAKGWRVEIPVRADAMKVAKEAMPQLTQNPAPVLEKRPLPVAPIAPIAETTTPKAPEISLAEPVVAPTRMLGKVSEFPNLLGKFARATSPTSVLIEWPVKIAPATGLRFQIRQMSLGDAGELKVDWKELPPVDIKTSAGKLSAEIQGLTMAQVHTIRAFNGKETAFTVEVATPPKPPFINIQWRTLFILLMFLTLALFAWRKWKTRVRGAW